VGASWINAGQEEQENIDAERDERQEQQTLELAAIAIRVAARVPVHRDPPRDRWPDNRRRHEHRGDNQPLWHLSPPVHVHGLPSSIRWTELGFPTPSNDMIDDKSSS